MNSEAQNIREGLKSVIDFELGLDVVSLGLIRDITVDDAGVHITMILTSPMCPMASYLLQQVRERAVELTKRPVEVVLGHEPWRPEMMDEDARAMMGL